MRCTYTHVSISLFCMSQSAACVWVRRSCVPWQCRSVQRGQHECQCGVLSHCGRSSHARSSAGATSPACGDYCDGGQVLARESRVAASYDIGPSGTGFALVFVYVLSRYSCISRSPPHGMIMCVYSVHHISYRSFSLRYSSDEEVGTARPFADPLFFCTVTKTCCLLVFDSSGLCGTSASGRRHTDELQHC